MVKKQGSRINIPMCVAGVLLCLTFFSIHLCGGLYARYTVSSSAADSARVIRFGELTLTETGDFYEANKLRVTPGVNMQKKAVVTFEGSESATHVFFEAEFAGGWTTSDNVTFSLAKNGKTCLSLSVASGWSFLSESGGRYVFYRTLAPNTPLNGVDIFADDGRITVSNQITENELAQMTGVSIRLRASVVQAGGFASVSAAWASLASK